jgi:Sulfotransferase domain
MRYHQTNMTDFNREKERTSTFRRLLAERFNHCVQPLRSYHGKATRTVKHLCISHWVTSNLGIILLLFLVFCFHRKTELNVSFRSQGATLTKQQTRGNITATTATEAVVAVGTDIKPHSYLNKKEYFSSFDRSDSSSPRRRIPLIVGAGMGSTGTRSLHYACCKLGIPSLHYKMYCPSPADDHNHSSNNNNLHHVLLREHQRQAIEAFHQMRDLQYHNQKINATLVTKLKRHVAQIVTSSSSSSSSSSSGIIQQVVAIHDTPFPQMLSFILQIAQEQDIPVIILLTERDSREWIQSRSKHAMEPSLICKDSNHAFDIIACMENYDKKRDNNHDDYPNDIFMSAFQTNNNTMISRFDYFESAAKAMERHQNLILSTLSPALVVNFWQDDSNEGDDESSSSFHDDDMTTLKKKLWHSIRPWLSLDAIQLFQNHARNGGLKMLHL